MDEGFLKIREYIKNSWAKTVRKKDYRKDFVMPYDYVSPCADGLLTELYYWDTYFTNKGLYADGMDDYARNNILDLQFALKTFGCVPNICRKDGAEYCSQPPLLFLMVKDYYRKNNDKEFLRNAYAVLKEEYSFWMTKRISQNGLNHYGSNHTFCNDGKNIGYYVNYYVERLKINVDGWSESKSVDFCENMVSEAESGEDFTPRFNGQAKNVNAVDLNSFLYGLEKEMEVFSEILDNGEKNAWAERSAHRKDLMEKYCYDKETGVFFDYNFKTGKRTGIYCVACYMPFVFGLSKDVNALSIVNLKLIYGYGVVSCQKMDGIPLIYQWGYPNAWPPHQFWAFKANMELGNMEIALDIAKKYLGNVLSGFSKQGILFEKYDAVNGGKAEVNEYVCPEMLGWTAGVYNYFYNVCHENDKGL